MGKGDEGKQKHRRTSLKKTVREIKISVLTGSVSIQTLQNANVEHRTEGNLFQAANLFTHHVRGSLESNSGQYSGSRNKIPTLTSIYSGQGRPPIPQL